MGRDSFVSPGRTKQFAIILPRKEQVYLAALPAVGRVVPFALLDSSHPQAPVQSARDHFFSFQQLMHLLPCPSCDASIPVSPAQAGNQSNCPNCQSSVQIPKLGDLRLLPQTDQATNQSQNSELGDRSAARSFGFGLFAFAAAGCLLIGLYCGIRWFLTDVTMTTDKHIEQLRTEYRSLPPAKLIREYEAMEKFGLDLPEPYPYKITENAKQAWGRNTLIAAAAGLGSMLLALILGASGRRKSTL